MQETSRKTFPGLLPDVSAAEVLMYPPETVVAEKFETMIRFGETNGRIKDFHDLWVTARTFPFDLAILTEAVGGTLRRRTAIPTEQPVALTPRFADTPNTQGMGRLPAPQPAHVAATCLRRTAG